MRSDVPCSTSPPHVSHVCLPPPVFPSPFSCSPLPEVMALYEEMTAGDRWRPGGFTAVSSERACRVGPEYARGALALS